MAYLLNLSDFRPHNMYSAKDFISMHEHGFKNTYSCIEKAMKFYDSDPDTCCEKFRKALEAAIDDIYRILKCKNTSSNVCGSINELEDIIPERFFSDEIISEMHNLRIIGNNYVHNSSEEERDSIKDRLTCYCAMKRISEWMINLKELYPDYLKECEEEEKKRKKRRKKSWAIVGGITAGLAAVGAVVAAVLSKGKD